MGLSEYYKSRPYKEWIEDWELGIDEEDGQAFFYHTAPTWLSIRDLIHEAGLITTLHLDKIAEGTFPPELLPEHLRDTYLKAR